MISGEIAVITPALRASAGRTLPGLPTATANRYTLPMIAARTTEGGNPETNA